MKKEMEGQTHLEDLLKKTCEKSSDNKDAKIMVRMDSDLKTLLEKFSKKNDISPSEYARDSIIEKIVNELDINQLLMSKKEYEEKYINLIMTLQTKIDDDFWDKNKHFIEYEEIEETVRLNNLLLKWYYEKVLQK
jgi:methylphosphotriester-DNA--protein-cysteine methyltransferase